MAHQNSELHGSNASWADGPSGAAPAQQALDAHQLAMLRSIDVELAQSFNSVGMMELYADEMVAPRSTPMPDLEQDTHHPTSEEITSIQYLLDVLTRAKVKNDKTKGKEGEENPNDPTDLLLAHGLNALLHKVALTLGRERQPGIMVSFESLTCKAEVAAGTELITNGSKLMNMFTFWRRRQTAEKYILKDLTGSFRPGRTTLLLGPPQSGKSSLMKAISGRMTETHRLKLEGKVYYGGRQLSPDGSLGGLRLSKLVGYAPQTDDHIPTLTVRETMRFAHECTARVSKEKVGKESFTEKEHAEVVLMDELTAEITMALLGIRHVGDTIVGNEKLRGISGGQRKRLTTGEALVTSTPVLLADEISTGLDSATTFDICNALKAFARCWNNTMVVSLLQPTPETYDIFDEILVMAAGHIAYQGPRSEVLPYFERLGFECPPAKHVAEFLQEVTLPQGIRKYRRTAKEEPGIAPVIQTPEDFGPAWRNSELFMQRLRDDVDFTAGSRADLDALPKEGFYHHKFTSKYTRPLLGSIWLCLLRQFTLTVRNKEMTVGRMLPMIFLGVVSGSLFWDMNDTDFNVRYAVMFFAEMTMVLGSLSLIPGIFTEKHIIYRQLDAQFFPPVAYSIAWNIVDIPISFLEALVFASPLYWMAGFSPVVSDFFVFVLTLFLLKLAMGSVFAVLAVFSSTMDAAQALASIVLSVTMLHAGFFLAYEDMHPWTFWIYWIDPYQYGITTLALNEFHSSSFSQLRDVNNPSLGTLGDYALELKKMPTNDHRLYLGWIFNICCYVVLTVVYTFIIAYLRWPKKVALQPKVTEQQTDGEGIDIPCNDTMPFTPCTLAWNDITYDVDDPGKKGSKGKLALRLLSHVSGFAKPGTMTALMGTSGAGKTTLLDVLAGRKNTGRIEGDILLNGQRADPVTFGRYAGYVEQNDIHSPTMTVLEALRFSAMLRLPRDLSAEAKEAFVWQVLSMLNLLAIVHCPIGEHGSGLSVEQTKRVTLGVEMAANPSVLFLDEPTSGLDSMAADTVMDALKAVTASGRTLICTIHQPSSYLFSMFQHLLLLVKGGRVAFFGRTGDNSSDLVAYLNSIPGAIPHDGIQNPATWMLNVVAMKEVDFPAVYEGSQLCFTNMRELQDAILPEGEPLTAGHHYQATVLQQFTILLRKWMRVHWRTPSYNLVRTFSCILVSLLMGCIFYQVPAVDAQTLFSRVGIQFEGFQFIGLLFATTIQNMVTTERSVFYRERAARMYHPLVFNMVTGLAELPYVLFNSIIFVTIYYWMIGLAPDAALFFFWYFTFLLYVLFYTYFGSFMGFLLPNAAAATGVISAFAATSVLLSGFLLPRSSIPWWWRWLHYALPMTNAAQCILSTQFFCAAADIDATNPEDCPTIEFPTINGSVETIPVWTYVQDAFDLAYYDRWICIGVLFGLLATARIGQALALMFVNHDKR